MSVASRTGSKDTVASAASTSVSTSDLVAAAMRSGQKFTRSSTDVEYDMYVVPVLTLLRMEELIPHQEMLERGLLEAYTPEKEGKILFVSHQWLGFSHPDPEFDQFPCLQRLLLRLMEGNMDIEQDAMQKIMFKQEGQQNNFSTVTGAEWKEMLPKMYVWFDYISMPQPNAEATAQKKGSGAHGVGAHGFGPVIRRTVGAHGMGAHGTGMGAHGTGSHAGTDHRHAGSELSRKLAMAVRSIPAYVEHSTYMLVLAPLCQHADLDMVCGFRSWRTRGWCRMELMAAVLAQHKIPIIVAEGPEAHPYMLLGLDSMVLSPGEGDFACCGLNHEVDGKKIGCDKHKVRAVLEVMLQNKAKVFHDQGDTMRFRYWTCARTSYLRGLPGVKNEAKGAKALKELLEWTAEDDKAGEEQGWSLLHWAALADDTQAVEELSAGQPKEVVDMPCKQAYPDMLIFQHVTPFIVAMSHASFDTCEALLKNGADPEYTTTRLDEWGMPKGQGVAEDAVMFAAINRKTDNVKKFLAKYPKFPVNVGRPGCGSTTCHAATMLGLDDEGVGAILKAGGDANLTQAMGHTSLSMACWCKDSNPDTVRRLVAEGCEVNHQSIAPGMLFASFCASARAKYWLGSTDTFTLTLAVAQGSTPLHFAVYQGQVETAKVLLELGADPTIKNYLGYTPLDMAKASFGEVPEAFRAMLGEKKKPGFCCAALRATDEVVVDGEADSVFAPLRSLKKPEPEMTWV